MFYYDVSQNITLNLSRMASGVALPCRSAPIR
jgi:hypothetical protein